MRTPKGDGSLGGNQPGDAEHPADDDRRSGGAFPHS